MARTKSSSRARASGKRKAATARKRARPPTQLSPAEVRAHPFWGPLLCEQIPNYDPCHQAEDCYFDTELAERRLRFFPRILRHVKGPLHGQPFELQPCQQSIVANAHGWRRPDGTRRYKVIFIYMPKKQGKSAFLGGWANAELADAPSGSELYIAAAAQKQAGVIFDQVAGMVKLNPIFQEKGFELYGDKGGSVQKAVTVHGRMLSLRCLAADADTVDGFNPYLALIDELHRHKKPDMAELLETSAVQPNAQTVMITTADYDRPSVCNTKLAFARAVCLNHGDKKQAGYAPTFLPCVWEADPKDDWRKESTWRKANPLLGVSKSIEFMREQARDAAEMPSRLNNFLRLHLNIVTSSVETYLNMESWHRKCVRRRIAPGHVEEWIEAHKLEGRYCYAGLDLAKVHDLTGFVKLFPPLDPENPREPFIVVPRFWRPEAGIRDAAERDHAPYEQWSQEGFLEVTEGDVTDFNVIERAIAEDSHRFPFAAELAFDSWNADQLIQRLDDVYHIKAVEFRQGAKSYHPALTELDRLIRDGRIEHGGHPVLAWCANNLKVRRDENDNVTPSKKRSTGRIDGITALCMALGVYILSPRQPQSADQALLEEPLYE